MVCFDVCVIYMNNEIWTRIGPKILFFDRNEFCKCDETKRISYQRSACNRELLQSNDDVPSTLLLKTHTRQKHQRLPSGHPNLIYLFKYISVFFCLHLFFGEYVSYCTVFFILVLLLSKHFNFNNIPKLLWCRVPRRGS